MNDIGALLWTLTMRVDALSSQGSGSSQGTHSNPEIQSSGEVFVYGIFI